MSEGVLVGSGAQCFPGSSNHRLRLISDESLLFFGRRSGFHDTFLCAPFLHVSGDPGYTWVQRTPGSTWVLNRPGSRVHAGFRLCSGPGFDGWSSSLALQEPTSSGMPKCFCWPSGFWRPGAPMPKNHTFSGREWLFGLAAFGGEANKPQSSLKMCGLLASLPQASKKTLGQKTSSGSL